MDDEISVQWLCWATFDTLLLRMETSPWTAPQTVPRSEPCVRLRPPLCWMATHTENLTDKELAALPSAPSYGSGAPGLALTGRVPGRAPIVMLDYDQQKDIHLDLVSLYPRVAEEKCYFRVPSADTTRQPGGGSLRAVVDRDRAVCAVVNKLVTTQRAIFVLCEARMGDDAYALSRIALENAVILGWLLHPEHWRERLDVYVNSYSQAQVRLDAVIQKHHAGTVAARSLRDAITEEDRSIAAELFDGQWQKWAVVGGTRWTFKDMAGEVFEGDFFYDRIFLETSWFVHSGFRSCLDIVAELRSDECYSLRVRYNRKTAAYGLFLSNTAVLVALAALDRRTPIGLTAEIQRVLARLRES